MEYLLAISVFSNLVLAIVYFTSKSNFKCDIALLSADNKALDEQCKKYVSIIVRLKKIVLAKDAEALSILCDEVSKKC